MKRNNSLPGKENEGVRSEGDESADLFEDDRSFCSARLELEDCNSEEGSSMSNLYSTSVRSLVGRKKNRFTLILEKFYTKNSRNPKKEFFNTYVIRSIKRIFRNISQNATPRRTCVAISDANPTQSACWEKFKTMFKKKPEFYIKISLTTNAPLTDGRSRRKEKNTNRTAKSHNNTFCRNFFIEKKMQKSFFILLDLLFSENELTCFNSRFKFMCCAHNMHNEDCYEKWDQLKVYLYNKYFDDLEIKIDSKLEEYSKRINHLQRSSAAAIESGYHFVLQENLLDDLNMD